MELYTTPEVEQLLKLSYQDVQLLELSQDPTIGGQIMVNDQILGYVDILPIGCDLHYWQAYNETFCKGAVPINDNIGIKYITLYCYQDKIHWIFGANHIYDISTLLIQMSRGISNEELVELIKNYDYPNTKSAGKV